MKRSLSIIIVSLQALSFVNAQNVNSGIDGDMYDAQTNTFNPSARSKGKEKEEKKVEPRGMYVWTVDPLFGDRIPQRRDTLQHLFMNSVFTSGMHGEYNTTGNLGAPRQNRIFMDRSHIPAFIFTDNLDFFLTPVSELRFTNTLSPITNLNFYSCGDRTDGEDYLKALFAANVNKRLGFGMKFNYMYGRGYYASQSTALFDYTLWTSYLGERYQAHFAFSTDHMKNTENGGILNDEHITRPEFYSYQNPSELPTALESNWNKNDALHFFLTHRYNVGFYRKVPMTQQEIEARKFAIAARKEAEEREKQQKGEVDRKGNALSDVTGRPKDAKIEGDLPSDSAKVAVSDRVSVGSEAMADSLLAAKSKMEEDTVWLKDEYVPVTSFIHTAKVDRYSRNYLAYATPTDYYLLNGKNEGIHKPDSINDGVNYTRVENTFAIAMLEGFNKYVPTGLKAYATVNWERYQMMNNKRRMLPAIETGNAAGDVPSADIPAADGQMPAGDEMTTPPAVVEKEQLVTEPADLTCNEVSVYLGAQLSKTLGSLFHYNIKGEYCTFANSDKENAKANDLRFDGTADVNVPVFGDTVRVDLDGFYHNMSPDFFFRHYRGKYVNWDNGNLNKQKHTHIGGAISYPRTKTSIRVGVDNIKSYTYMAVSNVLATDNVTRIMHGVSARQADEDVNVITAELSQNFRTGVLNWENRLTYQYCDNREVLPLPRFNVWSNLYLDFKIARVLSCHFGAAVTYFSKYDAPEYAPSVSQFAVQENSDVRKSVGNYPFVDVYANFVLKGCRFFVMMSHVNAGQGSKQYFTVPHYPMNERVFRLGISWNFYN